ncbi:MAG: AzlC family ABC transporter permease [Actinomycetes bacterium]
MSVKRDSFSLSFAVGAYGTAFGAASVTAHFSVLQTCLLSLLTFSGASQFAVIGVVGAGGSALSAIATASLLGTRNALYGVRMAPILKVRGFKRVVAAQVTIDESTAIATAQSDEADQVTGFWHTGFGVFVFWNIFTLLGALGAKAIGNPSAWGLDAAVPAAFIGLVWPRLIDTKTRLIAGAAIVLSLALVPFTPAGVPIITTALLAIIVGWRA